MKFVLVLVVEHDIRQEKEKKKKTDTITVEDMAKRTQKVKEENKESKA